MTYAEVFVETRIASLKDTIKRLEKIMENPSKRIPDDWDKLTNARKMLYFNITLLGDMKNPNEFLH